MGYVQSSVGGSSSTRPMGVQQKYLDRANTPAGIVAGYAAYWNFIAFKLADLAGERFQHLHYPFGSSYGVASRFDQYLISQHIDAVTHLTDGAQRAFREPTDRGIQMLGYLGDFDQSPELLALERAGDYPGYEARVFAACRPLTEANWVIGVDNGSSYATASRYPFRAMLALKAAGVRVVPNGWPEAGWEHYRAFPIMLEDSHAYQIILADPAYLAAHLSLAQHPEAIMHYNNLPPGYWAPGAVVPADYYIAGTALNQTWRPGLNAWDAAAVPLRQWVPDFYAGFLIPASW